MTEAGYVKSLRHQINEEGILQKVINQMVDL
jgi:hypothetical protein